MREYYVYIMRNWSRTLYIGMTNDLMARVNQHKTKAKVSFTSKYNVTDLVYYEQTDDVSVAIGREKQLKGWLREKKIALIESANPEWRDMSLDWADLHPQTLRSAQGDNTKS
jgi:putative endonuclease